MIKHLEVKTYQYGDVNVMVEINYDLKRISLVERSSNFNRYFSTKPKNYVFVERELEYMNGWRNVLNAMKYAIDEAELELSTYIKLKQKEKEEDVTAILLEATDIVKKKGKVCIIHKLADCKSKKCKL